MKYVGHATIFVATVFINTVINGWAFSVVWAWFISTTFSLPEISIPVAIGLILTFGFLMPRPHKDHNEKDFIEIIMMAFVEVLTKSLVIVGLGWIVLQFV